MPYEATPDAPRSLAPGELISPAAFRVPRWACDTHAHIISADCESHPLVAHRSYTPVPCPEARYLAMLDAMGMDRGVLVQVSVYGTDNRYLLEVLRRHPRRLRGIAVVSPEVTEHELADMHEAGVRGLRLNVLLGGGIGFHAMETLAAKIEGMGWHLQLLVDARQLPDLLPRLQKLRVPVVVDHMGHMPVELGVAHAGFQALKHVVVDLGGWTKLSGAYRISSQPPPYPDVASWAHELIAAAPERMLWGSDWPHVAVATMPDTGLMRDLLATWIPDSDLRTKVLVSNPERLYGFDASPPA